MRVDKHSGNPAVASGQQRLNKGLLGVIGVYTDIRYGF